MLKRWARSRWQALKGVWWMMDEKNLSLMAAGVAFSALFALFPGTGAVIALWSYWYDPAVIQEQLRVMDDIIPHDAYTILEDQVIRVVEANAGLHGWALLLTFGVAIWSAGIAVDSLLRGMNLIYGRKNPHSLLNLAVSFALTIILIAVALVALAAVVVVPILLALFPLGQLERFTSGVVHWGPALGIVVAGIWLLYRFGPSRNGGQPVGRLMPGVAFAVTLWGVASVAFSYFLANFGRYNEVYGSLAAVAALLMWLYISAYAVLFGAALNAELDRQSPGHVPEKAAGASGPTG